MSPAVAMIGLGEAGSAIATDLVTAGASVRGWDPVAPAPDGVEAAADAADAVTEADVVISANSAAVALDVAGSTVATLGEGQVFADLNTAAPALKRELAKAVGPTGALFADVALIGPVPGNGLRTRALVSGDGAESFAADARAARDAGHRGGRGARRSGGPQAGTERLREGIGGGDRRVARGSSISSASRSGSTPISSGPSRTRTERSCSG